jgi:hypothetical protein
MPVLTSVLCINSQESGAYDSGEKYGARDHGDMNSLGMHQFYQSRLCLASSGEPPKISEC